MSEKLDRVKQTHASDASLVAYLEEVEARLAALEGKKTAKVKKKK